MMDIWYSFCAWLVTGIIVFIAVIAILGRAFGHHQSGGPAAAIGAAVSVVIFTVFWVLT